MFNYDVTHIADTYLTLYSECPDPGSANWNTLAMDVNNDDNRCKKTDTGASTITTVRTTIRGLCAQCDGSLPLAWLVLNRPSIHSVLGQSPESTIWWSNGPSLRLVPSPFPADCLLSRLASRFAGTITLRVFCTPLAAMAVTSGTRTRDPSNCLFPVPTMKLAGSWQQTILKPTPTRTLTPTPTRTPTPTPTPTRIPTLHLPLPPLLRQHINRRQPQRQQRWRS